MARQPAANKQRGVSALESLLATAIAGVLTTSAIAPMQDFAAQRRLKAASSDLYASFNLARSEAITRGSAVAVIPADGDDWSTGWKVFADTNDSGAQDDGEATLIHRDRRADRIVVRPHFGATYPGKVLSYNGEGRLHRPGGAGLVIGRLVLTQDGAARSLCFASLALREHKAAICD